MVALVKKGWRPALCMVLLQIFTTGMVLITKVVIDGGMFVFALLAYRCVVGAVCVLPFALFFEKGKWREIGWKAVMWIFISTLLGFSVPFSLYYYGLGDTSPGYAINFLNIVPITTFVLAVICGKESLSLGSLVGSMKVFGTAICVGGTLVIGLFKGKALHLWPNNIGGYHAMHADQAHGSNTHDHIQGTFLLVGSCLSIAAWYMVQAQMLKVYPFKYWATIGTCLFGSIQTSLVGVILNRQKAAWELNWNLQLLAIVYSGVLNTAAKFCMISWVVTERGPIFPSMFSAVSVIFTTILDSLFMGHNITIGSLLGMVMVLGGLYLFLWGKRKELSLQSEEDEAKAKAFTSNA